VTEPGRVRKTAISSLISLLSSFMMMVFARHMIRWRLPAVPVLGRA
jgi:hypothetical protein